MENNAGVALRRLPWLVACLSCGASSGSAWMAEPLTAEARAPGGWQSEALPPLRSPRPAPVEESGEPEAAAPAALDVLAAPAGPARKGVSAGRALGTFRNTYYDFPSEADYPSGAAKVALRSASCGMIAPVSRGFHDAVCVQGSGRLASGQTVSFARRDCECALVCPRSGQRVCFDVLDPARFPNGRGAAGTAITPLRTVAADTRVLPLGTVIYVPELDGALGSDGCFVVEDRGTKVVGQHIDVFTGAEATTARINAQVPSNRGVTVVVDVPRCAHLGAAR